MSLLFVVQGIVPADVHLLPGQLRDVYEVIGDQNKPPPLPSNTTPRPRLDMTSPGDMRGAHDDNPMFMNGSNGYPGRSRSGEDSSDSGSFSSHMTRNAPLESHRPIAAPSSGPPVRSLRDLQRRQSEMADRDLGFVDDGSHSSHGNNGGHMPYMERQTSHQSYQYQDDRMSSSPDNNNDVSTVANIYFCLSVSQPASQPVSQPFSQVYSKKILLCYTGIFTMSYILLQCEI